MPEIALVGARYYQEMAPKVAVDRSEILSVTDTMRVPAGLFKNVLKIKDTTPLEPNVIEFKYYTRGVGLINDAGAKLVKYGYI